MDEKFGCRILFLFHSFSLRGLVIWFHVYCPSPDPVSLVRDHGIKEKLAEIGISVQSYNGDLLYEPWEIYDEKGQAFTTFDAYWDKCLNMQTEPIPLLPPWRLVPAAGKFKQNIM